ncbi:MAG TPA: DUF2069 domain-containing protein [Casimicrobiaceae bacterium]|nr:DUF2069 domain-containing protein [Casimicrobiaceae bacterium]
MWELWLAPLRPGGSWLALKALPLALLWVALARGARVNTIAALVVLAYFIEAVVRAASEHGRAAGAAAVSLALSVLAFVCLYLAARAKTAR